MATLKLHSVIKYTNSKDNKTIFLQKGGQIHLILS
jgi:hypothetical protein